jgi:hypothetical protein
MVVWMVLVAGMTGANAGTQTQILGVWVGDVDTAMAAQNMDAASDDPMVQMVVAMLEGIKVNFGADTVTMEVTMMGDTQQLSMGYEVLETTDDTLKIRNLDGPKEGVVSTITLLGDDQIMIAEEGGRQPPTYLKRVGADSDADRIGGAEEEVTVNDGATMAAEVMIQDEPQAPVFLVVIPEQIDTEWFWYYHTETAQDIVQGEVEKYLIRAGLEVLDLNTLAVFSDAGSMEELMNKDSAVEKARAAKATYLILGKASAVMQGRNVAYGVEVIRSKATAMARIIRVSDGKIMAVEDAEAEEGGQAQKATGQAALKAAGKKLGRSLARAAERIAEEEAK